MDIGYIFVIPAIVFLTAFGVYLCGRLFGLGFRASLKQPQQETKRGTRQ